VRQHLSSSPAAIKLRHEDFNLSNRFERELKWVLGFDDIVFVMAMSICNVMMATMA
jgi:hypothetical protein